MIQFEKYLFLKYHLEVIPKRKLKRNFFIAVCPIPLANCEIITVYDSETLFSSINDPVSKYMPQLLRQYFLQATLYRCSKATS